MNKNCPEHPASPARWKLDGLRTKICDLCALRIIKKDHDVRMKQLEQTLREIERDQVAR